MPQFIDKEDRIIGPITVRQFLICLVSAGIIFAEYKLLETSFFILALIPTAGLAGTFAFIKINGQPFHLFFVNFMQTQIRPKLRVWNKDLSLQELRGAQKVVGLPTVEKAQAKKRPSSTKLRDLALVVNTGGVYRPEEDELQIQESKTLKS